MREVDVVVIGGGQAGLAVAYYLRRQPLSVVVLDAENGPGGAWQHGWESLCLFSPARWSSLPGVVMPGGDAHYPTRAEVLAYLAEYERRYRLPVERPVWVASVCPAGERLRVATDRGDWLARAVVSATGTWHRPVIPNIPGCDRFRGEQRHSASYVSPLPFAGQRVLVVGGGNSGAQIQAELSLVAEATWVTRRPPTFLPNDVDGRVLFWAATERYLAHQRGEDPPPSPSFGDIVMVPPVREARARGALEAVRPFVACTERGVRWADGREERVDAIIWCTGFRPALEHLRPLGVLADGRVATRGTRSLREPRLWLVGYGDWTGDASATLIGVGRTARATVEELAQALGAAR